jgi:WD40 repeat protein
MSVLMVACLLSEGWNQASAAPESWGSPSSPEAVNLDLKLIDTPQREPSTYPATGRLAFGVIDGREVLATGAEFGVIVWDPVTGKELGCYGGIDGDRAVFAKGIAFSPDGSRLAYVGMADSGSANGIYLVIWNTRTGELLHSLASKKDPQALSVAFSPDGRRLATGWSNGEVRVWDVATGKKIRSYRPDPSPTPDTLFGAFEKRVREVSYSPDGNHLFSCQQNCVVISDAASGKRVRSYEYNEYPGGNDFHGMALSPNGRQLATGSSKQNRLDLWFVGTERKPVTLASRNLVSSISFHPLGVYLATAAQGKVKVWNVDSGECVYTLKQDEEWVYDVAWSRSGRYLAAHCGGSFKPDTPPHVDVWEFKLGKR